MGGWAQSQRICEKSRGEERGQSSKQQFNSGHHPEEKNNTRLRRRNDSLGSNTKAHSYKLARILRRARSHAIPRHENADTPVNRHPSRAEWEV